MRLIAGLLLLAWALPAYAQTPSLLPDYRHLVSAPALARHQDVSLAQTVAQRHWPNTSLERLTTEMRGQFMGRLAEHWLAQNHPELEVHPVANDPVADVRSPCRGGTGCTDGFRSFQVKVHRDGNPATYFRELVEARYEAAHAFIVPQEHREAVRRLAVERGRPDIAAKITEDYAMRLEDLEAATDATRTGHAVAWASRAAGFLGTAYQLFDAVGHCYRAFDLRCAFALGDVALGEAGPFLARGLGRLLGVDPSGVLLALHAAFEVASAFQAHGFTWRGVAMGVVGASAVFFAAKAAGACFVWGGGPTPIGLTAAALCGIGARYFVRELGAWLVDHTAQWAVRTQAAHDALIRESTEAARERDELRALLPQTR